MNGEPNEIFVLLSFSLGGGGGETDLVFILQVRQRCGRPKRWLAFALANLAGLGSESTLQLLFHVAINSLSRQRRVRASPTNVARAQTSLTCVAHSIFM